MEILEAVSEGIFCMSNGTMGINDWDEDEDVLNF